MGERSTFGEPLEMMAKGALLVLPSKVESTCHGRSIPTEAIPRPIRLAKRALRWPRCSHSAHSRGSGRDSVLEKDIWLYLQHLATFAASSSRPLKLTTSASCICFHTSSRRSSKSVSSFDSYIETIEMQGVCPTWLRGLGCRGAHRSERLRIASLSTSLTSPRSARFHRQPRAQEHPGPNPSSRLALIRLK